MHAPMSSSVTSFVDRWQEYVSCSNFCHHPFFYLLSFWSNSVNKSLFVSCSSFSFFKCSVICLRYTSSMSIFSLLLLYFHFGNNLLQNLFQTSYLHQYSQVVFSTMISSKGLPSIEQYPTFLS